MFHVEHGMKARRKPGFFVSWTPSVGAASAATDAVYFA
jgi:hypothetical protein